MSAKCARCRRSHPSASTRPLPSHPARGGPSPAVVLRAHTGEVLPLDPGRWHAPASAEEVALLARVAGPAIDLGCGPGRIVARLVACGVPALGVDSSPAAVAFARRRGATVLQRDVFAPLPGEGTWATALLFDGTVGIGGDPVRLLGRCRALTGHHGRVLAEVEPPGVGWRPVNAWFEHDGERGPVFDWAIVGADGIAEVAGRAGFQVASLESTPSGRWFAFLEASAA